MTIDLVLSLLSQMFSVALQLALPVMLASLIVGLMVSIFQVVTQIQEMTLTFVPKILVSVVTLAMFGHWMLSLLIDFSKSMFSSIAQL